MTNDDFDAVVRVVRGSVIARTLGQVVACGRSAAPRSYAAGVVGFLRRRVRDMPITERLRLAGLLVLTATIAQGLALQVVPAVARPAAPRLLRGELIVAGLVLMVAARGVARAWPASHVRWLLRRPAAASRARR